MECQLAKRGKTYLRSMSVLSDAPRRQTERATKALSFLMAFLPDFVLRIAINFIKYKTTTSSEAPQQQTYQNKLTKGRLAISVTLLADQLDELIKGCDGRLVVHHWGLEVFLDTKRLPAIVDEHVVVAESVEQPLVGEHVRGHSFGRGIALADCNARQSVCLH